eukprot:2559584-Amphidinium_carterae.2
MGWVWVGLSLGRWRSAHELKPGPHHHYHPWSGRRCLSSPFQEQHPNPLHKRFQTIMILR